MTTPHDIAARRCRNSPPCGWCLWRAGYRKPRASRRIGVAGGAGYLFASDPAAPGTIERGSMSTEIPRNLSRVVVHVGDDHLEIARYRYLIVPGERGEKAKAFVAATLAWSLDAGVYRVQTWVEDAGIPQGRGVAGKLTVGVVRTAAFEVES